MPRRNTDTIAARSAAATSRALVLTGILIVIGLGMAVPLRSWLAQQAEIAALRAQVEQARSEVAALEVEQERWSDPAFIAAQARQRLLFVFPGEIGYIAIDTTTPLEEPTPEVDSAEVAWFERLWEGVADADAGPVPVAGDAESEQRSETP